MEIIVHTSYLNLGPSFEQPAPGLDFKSAQFDLKWHIDISYEQITT
jgi:hypothetical protein